MGRHYVTGQKRKPNVQPAQVIVTGKRVRKRLHSWSGSDQDSEPDPYGTDESDEWVPGSQGYSEDYV